MFEKQYPFIKVDLLRSGSGALVNRVISEYAAKNYAADVLHGMSTGAICPRATDESNSFRTERMEHKDPLLHLPRRGGDKRGGALCGSLRLNSLL
jgi:hypothetical protein